MKLVTVVAVIAERQPAGIWFAVDLDQPIENVDQDMINELSKLSTDQPTVSGSSDSCEFVAWIGNKDQHEIGRTAWTNHVCEITSTADSESFIDAFDLILQADENQLVNL